MHRFESLFPIDNKIISQGIPYEIYKSLENKITLEMRFLN
jgi:hypothetical protein